jgi:hypothetical protein
MSATGFLAATTLAQARAAIGALGAGDIQNQVATAFTTGGTATAFTLTPTPALTALATGQEFDVTFHAASGTTPTLAISGLTAKNLKYRDATGTKQAVTSTQVSSGWRSRVVYDGVDYIVREILGAGKYAFMAFRSSAQSAGAYVIFDTVIRQVGSGYNNATGVFTAPATGWYKFTFGVVLNNTGGAPVVTPIGLANSVNGGTFDTPLTYTVPTGGVNITGAGESLLYMTAGDTVGVFSYNANFSATYHAQPGTASTNATMFSGYYLGP